MNPVYKSNFYICLCYCFFVTTFVIKRFINMNNRLQQFLAAENISQAAFADKIKVARAGVSHILAGRNKPSYDFLSSLILHYPELSVEWIMTGKGKMYKQNNLQNPPHSEAGIDQELFTEESFLIENSPTEDFKEDFSSTSTNIKGLSKTPKHIDKQKNISKVIVLYDDGSFLEI